MIPLALTSIQSSLLVLIFLAALILWTRRCYVAIVREDERRQAEREDEADEWEWPVKLAGPKSRTRLPL